MSMSDEVNTEANNSALQAIRSDDGVNDDPASCYLFDVTCDLRKVRMMRISLSNKLHKCKIDAGWIHSVRRIFGSGGVDWKYQNTVLHVFHNASRTRALFDHAHSLLRLSVLFFNLFLFKNNSRYYTIFYETPTLKQSVVLSVLIYIPTVVIIVRFLFSSEIQLCPTDLVRFSS